MILLTCHNADETNVSFIFHDAKKPNAPVPMNHDDTLNALCKTALCKNKKEKNIVVEHASAIPQLVLQP